MVCQSHAAIVIAIALQPLYGGRLPVPLDFFLRLNFVLAGLWISARLIRPFVQHRRERS